MPETGFFFERKSFNNKDIRKAYYEYKGYVREDRHGHGPSEVLSRFPVLLSFGRNEICFYYEIKTGKLQKVFSLYVADGHINQGMLERKIENYWKLGSWKIPEKRKVIVNHALLSLSYYTSWYQFGIEDDSSFRFKGLKMIPEAQRKAGIILESEKIQFLKKPRGKVKRIQEKEDDDTLFDEWVLKGGSIETGKINFRKLLLDFLFELDNVNTFEDENFFILEPILQNNRLLDAITRKCRYIDQLYRIKDDQTLRRSKVKLSKQYLDAEKSWLSVCFLNEYASIFESVESVFTSSEREVERVVFDARLGPGEHSRNKHFTRDDAPLRNQVATFFLRNYSLLSGFRILLPPIYIWGLMLSLGLILGGDLLLHKMGFSLILPGGFSLWVPLILLLVVMKVYIIEKINLFKLLLPRMSLGILVGWSVFWSSGDLWKGMLTFSWIKLIFLSGVLFVLLFLYVFTDIRNKLVRISDFKLLGRSCFLIIFALMVSLMQGICITQFFFDVIYGADYQALQVDNKNVFCDRTRDAEFLVCQFRNDGKNPQDLRNKLLQDLHLKSTGPVLKDEAAISWLNEKIANPYLFNEERIKGLISQASMYKIPNNDRAEISHFLKYRGEIKDPAYMGIEEGGEINVIRLNRLVLEYAYHDIVPKTFSFRPPEEGTANMLKNKAWLQNPNIITEIPFIGGQSIIFLWPILFGQFMIAIMLGLVLQLLWEDRPITEPL